MKPQTVTKILHRYFYTNENFLITIIPFSSTPLPISILIEQQTPLDINIQPLLTHYFLKIIFNFYFSSQLPFYDARRRRRGSAKQWNRSKGKRLYLAARVSIYPVLSFISIPRKLFRGPFSIGEPIPASFSQAVPQPSRSSRSAYLRAFPSIKQPRA